MNLKVVKRHYNLDLIRLQLFISFQCLLQFISDPNITMKILFKIRDILFTLQLHRKQN